MITHSADFFTNMSAPVKTVRVRLVEVTEGSDEIEITSDDDLMRFKLEAKGSFLGTAGKKGTATIIGEHPELKDTRFLVYLAVLNPSDSTWDEIELGSFDVFQVAVDYDKGSTVVTFYDPMMMAAITPYNLSSEDFPVTVEGLADKVAASLDMTVKDMEGLPNVEYSITENLYALMSGFTLRDVVDEIAKSTGTTARVSGRELQFIPYDVDTVDMELTKANLRSYKSGELFGPINTVTLSRMPQNDNIAMRNSDSVEDFGANEVKIVNVEILDDARETLIEPIYDALVGEDAVQTIEGFETKTEGHGIYEVGDVIKLDLDETVDGYATYHTGMVTEIVLDISGGVSEVLKSVPPDPTNTDYASAGGIRKSIYNTELKVDKQNQTITSVVSRQDQIDQDIEENFSQVEQDIAAVITTIQTTGGGNLIKNSVGYGKDTDGLLVDWDNTGTITSHTSPESLNAGAVSGSAIVMAGEAELTQSVVVRPNSDTVYTIGFKAKKNTAGNATVKLSNSSDEWEMVIPDGESVQWADYSVVAMQPTLGVLDLSIATDSDVTDFEITDLYLVVGNQTIPWQQANGEILNTQVIINEQGVTVKSSIYDGDYTAITPLEFAGYSKVTGVSEKVFSLNRDTTIVKKLKAQDQIDMPPLKIVAIGSGDRAGWSFVEVVD